MISIQDSAPTPGEITKLLKDQSNPEALNQVVSLVYQDLRRIAGGYLKGSPDRTMQPTALVHEAYHELIKKQELQFQNRDHFFGTAAIIMRHILLRYARDMKRLKRGGNQAKIPLNEAIVNQDAMDPDALLGLGAALDKLKEMDADKHRLVELRSLLGLSMKEISQITGRSLRSVERDWKFCRLWLTKELTNQPPESQVDHS